MRSGSVTIPLLALLFSMVLAAPVSSGAQQTTLREGARVKVASTTQKEIVGVVQSMSADTLVLYTEPHGARLGVSIPAISEVQVSQGRLTSAGAKKGAFWGAIVGAVTTLFIVGIGEEEIVTAPGEEKISKGEFAAQNFIGSVILGAGIGALIKAEKWETVPFRAGVSASTGGISLRVSSAFR